MAARIDHLFRDYGNALANPLTLDSAGLVATLTAGTTPSGNRYFAGASSAHFSTGKWYYELVVSGVAATVHASVGWMADQGQINLDPSGWNSSGQFFSTTTAHDNGQITDFTTGVAVSGPSWSYGSTVTLMCAVDVDAGKFWHGLNGTWFGTGDPGAGTGQQWTLSSTYMPLLCVRPFFYINTFGTTAAGVFTFNFGSTTYSAPSGFSMIDAGESRQSGEQSLSMPAKLDSQVIAPSQELLLPGLARTPDTAMLGALRTVTPPELLRAAYSDVQYGARGKIYGTLQKKVGGSTLPAYGKARLLRSADLMVLGEVWSNQSTGAYEFDYVPLGVECIVLSVDHTGTYTAVVKDREFAVPM